MQVKRFVAADMRRALELVRQELGPDAIILSSGRVPEGVELLTTTGSDSELAQLQQQPLGRMAFASASPMMSDGAWAETEVIERAAKQHASSSLASNIVVSKSGSSNAGKSGQQLVNDIEQARLRMLAAQKAEESAKEFLVGRNTVVNAGIPRQAPGITAEAKTTEAKASRPQGRKAVAAPIEARVAEAKPKAMSAAERYPLVDDEDKVSLSAKSNHVPAFAASNELHELQAEIADMRLLLEQQLDRLTGTTSPVVNSPVLASVGRRL